jgi:lipopolysaccharide export system protein LptA
MAESEIPVFKSLRQHSASGSLPLLALMAMLSLIVGHPCKVMAQRQDFPLQPASASAAPQPPVTTATSGLVSIESDSQRADNQTGVITATGNVRIVYPDRKLVATARQAQYFSREERVILSGDVEIIQSDGHSMRAERVTYDVIRERLVAVPPAGLQVLSTYRLSSTATPPSTPQ